MVLIHGDMRTRFRDKGEFQTGKRSSEQIGEFFNPPPQKRPLLRLLELAGVREEALMNSKFLPRNATERVSRSAAGIYDRAYSISWPAAMDGDAAIDSGEGR
jgi:hypothetical protein